MARGQGRGPAPEVAEGQVEITELPSKYGRWFRVAIGRARWVKVFNIEHDEMIVLAARLDETLAEAAGVGPVPAGQQPPF